MADEQASYRSAIVCSISDDLFVSLNSPADLFTDVIVVYQKEENGGGRIATLACKTRFDAGYRTTSRELLLNAILHSCTTDKIRNLISEVGTCTPDVLDPYSINFLFARQCFLSRHNLTRGQTVFIREMVPLSLSRLVLSCQSSQEFGIGDTDIINDLSGNLCERAVVVRSSDILTFCLPELGKIKYQVLRCEPILQGILDPHTEIVLESYISNDEESGEEECLESEKEVLNLSSLLIKDFAFPITGILGECTENSERENMDTYNLLVNFTDWKRFKHLALFSRESHLADDINRVFVSLGMLVKMNIMNGSWVQLCINQADSRICVEELEKSDTCQSQLRNLSENKEPKGKELRLGNKKRILRHTAQIFALDNNYISAQEKMIYISPELLFNLLEDPARTNIRDLIHIEVHPIVSLPKVPQSEMKTVAPPFAREAHISLIASSNVKMNESFTQHLTQYFTVPRVLTINDVICINCNWQESDQTEIDEDQRSRAVYFKVIKLVASPDTSSCFVDTLHTSLYQKGVVHGFVPVLAEPTLHHEVDNLRKVMYPPGLESTQEEVESVIRPCLNNRSLQSVQVLLTGPSGTGKKTVAMATSRVLHLPVVMVTCYDLIGESVAATETRVKNTFSKANTTCPCILLLCNIHALGKDREGQEDEPRIASTMKECLSLSSQSDFPLVVIATSSNPEAISHDIFECFLHEIKMKTPSEIQRLKIMQGLASTFQASNDVDFDLLAKRTAGFVLADFAALFSQASRLATKRISHFINTKVLDGGPSRNREPWCSIEADVCHSGVTINFQDFQQALDALQASHSDAIGAPKIPDISWQDIGGLGDVKAEILDTIQLPFQHPELFAAGLRRSGVLLYGPPGTGKTLLAKAVATECALNFLSVKGPELINMYVGQSEQNVREVFTRAQSASPCVIFFDELDSLAPNRGRSGDSGGVMDRVVSQLLAELDGLHSTCDVFVIGATNRPDLLDPALLRPGRFDKLLYLGVSEDHHAQLNILKALTRKFNLAPDLNLDAFARECPLNLTGADLYALCSDAMLQSMRRIIQQHPSDGQEEDIDIEVCLADFRTALGNLTPSVTVQELERYKRIKHEFALS